MISVEDLRNWYRYEPETGVFFRRKPYKNPAGHRRKDGYWLIGIDYKTYLIHRIIWLYVYGHLPDGIIDHINGDPSDNRLCNLRCVDQGANIVNGKLRINNTSGYTGVSYHKDTGKWCARVGSYYIGLFFSKEEAHDEYEKTAERLFSMPNLRGEK